MGNLIREIQCVQNPALGAMILWRFTCGYLHGSKNNLFTPVPLLFIVLPIVLHQETTEFISSTRTTSGLRAFVDKFSISSTSKRDLILSIHNRAAIVKHLTLDSIKIGLSSKLISLDCNKGVAIPLSETFPKAGIPEDIRKMLKAAEKFGDWCSQLSLHEISITLKVVF